MFAFAAQAFVTMFVIIDPPGLAPIFISVAGDRAPEAQRHLARKAIAISAVVLAIFAASTQNVSSTPFSPEPTNPTAHHGTSVARCIPAATRVLPGRRSHLRRSGGSPR